MSVEAFRTREMPLVLHAKLRRLSEPRDFAELSSVVTDDCRREFCKSLGSMLTRTFGEAYLSLSVDGRNDVEAIEERPVSEVLSLYAKNKSLDLSRLVFDLAYHPDYRGFDDVAPILLEAIRPCWRRYSLLKVVDRSEFHIDFQRAYSVYRTAFSDPQMLWIQLQMMRAACAYFDAAVVNHILNYVSAVENCISAGAMPTSLESSKNIRLVPQFVGDYEPEAMSMVFQPTSVAVPLECASSFRGRFSQDFNRRDATAALQWIDKIIRDSFGGEIPDLTLSASGSLRRRR